MRRLILRSFQSPGDIVMLTAAIRDLHRARPGEFQTDVRTSAPELWKHNPYLTALEESDDHVRILDMHYPLIHQSNDRPYHFIHGYIQYLEQQLNVRIPVTEFRGDLHLSQTEKQPLRGLGQTRLPERFWLIVAGGKHDFTAKWWNPNSYQAVVNHFRDRLNFVQCGDATHWHPRLDGVTDLVGQTSLRDVVRLMYHAEGVVCPVTFAMHLSAAVETLPGRSATRPCVVIAGGREPTHWEAYPQHQFISTVGMLSCCASGGCWKSRCQPVGDGDLKDRRDRCEQPIQVQSDLCIPRCLDMITPHDVIRRIELYLEGHADPSPARSEPAKSLHLGRKPTVTIAANRPPAVRVQVSGRSEELVAVGIIHRHLRHYHPDWQLNFAVENGDADFYRLLDLGTEQRAELPYGGHHIRLNGALPRAYPNWPGTPAVTWLLDELKLTPVEDLFRIRLSLADSTRETIRDTLRQFLDRTETAHGQFPLVIFDIHLADGGLPQWLPAAQDVATAAGYSSAVLQWSHEQNGLLSADLTISGSEEAPQTVRLRGLSEILAVLEQARLVVGRETPSVTLVPGLQTRLVAIWETRHPVHVVEPSPHSRHLVPADHAQMAAGADAITYFERVYQYATGSPTADTVADLLRLELESPFQPQKPEPGVATMVVEAQSPPLTGVVPLQSVASPFHVSPAEGERSNGTATQVPSNGQDAPLQSVRFYHGLGDAANFARLIPLYTSRGHRIGVECTPDKAIVFRAAGAEIVSEATHTHEWGYPPVDVHAGHGRESSGSKAGWNISQPPLPEIGDKAELWPEYCRNRVRVTPFIPPHEREFVARWLRDLPRPIVLLHTKGNTAQAIKSLPDDVASLFYREMLDRFDGTLVLLDWDNRVPRLPMYRVRHLTDMSGGCPTERMFALMDEADLIVGVDSGPLHAAGLTDTPRVGIWMPGHYAARYSLPDPQQLNLVLEGATQQWNRYRRVPWNIVDQPGNQWNAAWLAEQCARMLQPPKYLAADQLGFDVQLQHWVGELCRGDRSRLTSAYTDRNRSFDVLLREATARFVRPTFVETGTIRSEEDWAGAGYSTYLFGAYLQNRGGRLHSVDLTPEHCQFARTWCQVFGETVHVHQQDSVQYLQQFDRPIDVLYLDSLDTTEPGHAEHAVREAQAAMHALHSQSLILFDDTPWREGAFCGKGAHAVPWLLNNGWKVLYAGYQVLLERRHV